MKKKKTEEKKGGGGGKGEQEEDEEDDEKEEEKKYVITQQICFLSILQPNDNYGPQFEKVMSIENLYKRYTYGPCFDILMSVHNVHENSTVCLKSCALPRTQDEAFSHQVWVTVTVGYIFILETFVSSSSIQMVMLINISKP